MMDQTPTPSGSCRDNPPPVLTKIDFVRRYALGEFGNGPLTWTTVEDYQRFGYKGLVHIRNRVKGGKTWYDVEPEDVVPLWCRLTNNAQANGVPPGTLYLSVMGPEDKKVFQGEVQRGLWGLDLFYNTKALPMRQVPPNLWRSERGIIAVSLLKQYLCPNSYEWLMVLLGRYPDHVVEFSTYSVEWGTLLGFNTVFWEVRLY